MPDTLTRLVPLWSLYSNRGRQKTKNKYHIEVISAMYLERKKKESAILNNVVSVVLTEKMSNVKELDIWT